MTDTGYSLSDIATASSARNNNNDGMFGGNSWAWIVIIFLFAIFSGRGFGGFGGGSGMTQPIVIDSGRSSGSGVADNYVLATDFANIERKLDGVNNGICDGVFALNNSINGNFRTLDGAICNLGYQALQNTNAIQTQLASCCCETQQNIERNTNQSILNTNAIQQQISSCCCDLEKANMQNRFDAQAYNCNTLQAIDKVGDRIIDYMANEKAQTLRDENQALRLAASQSAQNQYIINALRPMPIPAYSSCNPWAASYGCNGCCG